MDRSLAHIERIVSLFPIPGADKIEVAQVLGWYVVTQKGQHKVGDLVVFYEIDSFLNAEDPRYESFSERFSTWEGKRGMRLKTIKLRGQISQGLIMPVRDFPELTRIGTGAGDRYPINELPEGLDVTELLKIEKWESPEEKKSNGGGFAAKAGGKFPGFIPKTDQPRVQSMISMLHSYMDEPFERSVKLDGSSMTVFVVQPNSNFYADAKSMTKKTEKAYTLFGKAKLFLTNLIDSIANRFIDQAAVSGVCSRNIMLRFDDESHFTNYVKDNAVIEKMLANGGSFAVQGELIGPTIQDNHEQVDDFGFYIFDVFDIDAQKHLLPAEVNQYCLNTGLKHVPIDFVDVNLRAIIGETADNTETVKNILAQAEGPGLNPQVKREGHVYKHMKSGFSFKAISNSYLLKKEKSRPTT